MTAALSTAPELPPGRRRGPTLLVLVGFLVVLGLGIAIGRTADPSQPWRLAWWTFGTLVFGALVGLSEILSRYRDEPMLAATTPAGLSYVALNGVVSVAAFAVLRVYADRVFPAVKDDLFLTSVAAGLGAMVIFRSKLFTFRSPDGKEYAIGPAIVLETVLKTVDHKIDRQRATERQARVFREMWNMDDFESAARYIEASLNSFQNLTPDEKKEIKDVIEQCRTLTWPNSLKTMALGFAFLNISGEENFDRVVANMRTLARRQAEQARPTPAPPPAGP